MALRSSCFVKSAVQSALSPLIYSKILYHIRHFSEVSTTNQLTKMKFEKKEDVLGVKKSHASGPDLRKCTSVDELIAAVDKNGPDDPFLYSVGCSLLSVHFQNKDENSLAVQLLTSWASLFLKNKDKVLKRHQGIAISTILVAFIRNNMKPDFANMDNDVIVATAFAASEVCYSFRTPQARDSASLLYSVVKLGIYTVEIVRPLLRCAVRLCANFNSQGASNCLWVVAKMEIKNNRYLQPFLDNIVHYSSELEPQGVSMCLWAFAKLGVTDLAYMEPFLLRAIDCSANFNSQEVANILWSYSKLNVNEDKYLQPILTATIRLSLKFNAQDASNSFCAAVNLNVTQEYFLRPILESVNRNCVNFTSQNISNCLSALAKIGLRDMRYLDPILKRLDEFSGKFNTQECVSCLMPLSNLGLTDVVSVDKLIDRIFTDSENLSEQDVANVLWSFAVFNFQSDVEDLVKGSENVQRILRRPISNIAACHQILQCDCLFGGVLSKQNREKIMHWYENRNGHTFDAINIAYSDQARYLQAILNGLGHLILNDSKTFGNLHPISYFQSPIYGNVCVEFGERSHFNQSFDPNVAPTLNGSTLLRHRLFLNAGYQILYVPYYEFKNDWLDGTNESEYFSFIEKKLLKLNPRPISQQLKPDAKLKKGKFRRN